MKFTTAISILGLASAALAAPGGAPTSPAPSSSSPFTCTLQLANGGSAALTGTNPNGACNPLPTPEKCTGIMLSPGDSGAATVQLFSDSACKNQIMSQPANNQGTFTAQTVGSYCVNK